MNEPERLRTTVGEEGGDWEGEGEGFAMGNGALSRRRGEKRGRGGD